MAVSLFMLFPIAVHCRASEALIHVFGLFAPTELRLRPADSQILRLNAEGAEARLEGGQTASCHAASSRVVCRVGESRLEGASVDASGLGISAEFFLSVPHKIERRFRGRLVLKPAGSTLSAVVTMDRETAVSSIVAAESPPEAGFEALKAQAVAARSYLFAGPRHEDFDFCDTTHCQYLRAPPNKNDPAHVASAATAGLVLTHSGKIVRALYSRSCGGTTRSLRQAGLAAEGYPYYNVLCGRCSRAPEKWQTTFEREAARSVLEQPTEASRIELARLTGWASIPSTQFRAESKGDSVTLRGTGVGHGIGLCQRGAAAMAADGFDFSSILRHYFPNTRVGTASGL